MDLVLLGDQGTLALCSLGFHSQMLDLQKKRNKKLAAYMSWAHLTQHCSSFTKVWALKVQQPGQRPPHAKNPRQGPEVCSKSIFCWLYLLYYYLQNVYHVLGSGPDYWGYRNDQGSFSNSAVPMSIPESPPRTKEEMDANCCGHGI